PGLPIKVLPAEPEHFAPAQAVRQGDSDRTPVPVTLYGLQEILGLVEGERPPLSLSSARSCRKRSDVARYQPLFLCLCERPTKDVPHVPTGVRGVPGLPLRVP